jgi:hypothetical protein
VATTFPLHSIHFTIFPTRLLADNEPACICCLLAPGCHVRAAPVLLASPWSHHQLPPWLRQCKPQGQADAQTLHHVLSPHILLMAARALHHVLPSSGMCSR